MSGNAKQISLNHEADLSDSELDGVVGGSGLSLSSLKKGLESAAHTIEGAAHSEGIEASQAFHGLQSTDANAATTGAQAVANQVDNTKPGFNPLLAGLQTEIEQVKNGGELLKQTVDDLLHHGKADVETQKQLLDDMLKHGKHDGESQKQLLDDMLKNGKHNGETQKHLLDDMLKHGNNDAETQKQLLDDMIKHGETSNQVLEDMLNRAKHDDEAHGKIDPSTRGGNSTQTMQTEADQMLAAAQENFKQASSGQAPFKA